MGANPAYHNRVRYILENKEQGRQIITDPIGWETDDKEISRNEDYHGIFGKFSNSLTFVGSGYDFIRFVYENYGIESNIRLTREEANPQTDIFEKAYDGDLDLSTYERENDKIRVKFNSAGIETILKSRESENIEIERTESMDGLPLDPLRLDTVALDGRKINLRTFFNVIPTNDFGYKADSALATIESNGNTRYGTVGVPLNMYSSSHDEANSVIPESRGNDQNGTTGMMFFINTEITRTLKIKFDISWWANITRKDDTSGSQYGLYFTKYTNGFSYDRTEEIAELFTTVGNGGLDALGGDAFANPFTGVNNNPRTFHTASYEGVVTLEPGESLAFEFYVKSTLGNSLHRGHLDVAAQDIIATMSIVEDSYYDKSQCKFILGWELAERLLNVITSKKNILKSTALGRTDLGYDVDGIASLTGYTHGLAIRGFTKQLADLSDDDNENNNVLKYKSLTTSWRDFIASNNVIWNLGLGIERVGYQEIVVIEELSYFYSNQVTVKLPIQISKAKRSAASKYFYSGLELGYSKGGEYEEANGLDEYNAKSTFTTVIKRLKNVYSKLSPYRADSYGKEFARRKPVERYSTEDTRYDEDIFVMDLKRNIADQGLNGDDTQYVFSERLWQDDFEKEPTGTYSPETATNLRFSPFNILLRHGWVIAAGLTKNLLDYIRYGSSTANSQLKTQLKDGIEYAENGNILNAELKKARYKAEFIEFEHTVDNELMKQIEGFHMVNGKRTPNLYGLFEFIDEDNAKTRGYLINLKPNEGKFKLLISNR